MPYLNEQQHRLIMSFLRKEIGRAEFMRKFPLREDDLGRIALDVLTSALASKDESDVNYGMYLGFSLGFSVEHAETLTRLLAEDWHSKHEDIASTLQELRWQGAVDVLYRTALKSYDYLSYDDSYALGVKCIWALGDIGTPEALDKLRAISREGNRVLRANARKQLIRLGACERRRAEK